MYDTSEYFFRGRTYVIIEMVDFYLLHHRWKLTYIFENLIMFSINFTIDLVRKSVN